MRCFVTGASSFLGSHLVRLLLAKGAEVAVLVREESSNWRLRDLLAGERVRVLQGDLRRIDTMLDPLAEFAPEVTFHAAWFGVESCYRDHPDQIELNLKGGLALLEALRRAGCQHFIGVGSQTEYGECDGLLRETQPIQPTQLYGAVKACLGMLSQHLCRVYGLRWTWLRLSPCYGPMDAGRRLIPQVAIALLQGERPALSSGEQELDFLYVEDAVEALWLAACPPGLEGLYNVGPGQRCSVREIAERIRDYVDPRLPLGLGEIPRGAGRIVNVISDASRFRQATGWHARVSLEEGLHRTVDWHRAQIARTAELQDEEKPCPCQQA